MSLLRPAELFDVRDRVAAITGGAGNLGSVYARVLAGAGAKIALLDVSEGALAKAADALRAAGADVEPIVCDVGDASKNYSTPIIPFNMSACYKSDFLEKNWTFPTEILSRGGMTI